MVLTFEAQENGNYEALYDYVELPNGKETCGVKLFEIIETENNTYKKVEMSNYKVIENYCE